MIKNKFKITGMHCTSCAFNIDGELEDTDGVEEANTNFAKAQTEVKFNPEKVSVDKIIKLIKTVGYDATLA
jgi:copper chaperone CopZ